MTAFHILTGILAYLFIGMILVRTVIAWIWEWWTWDWLDKETRGAFVICWPFVITGMLFMLIFIGVLRLLGGSED